jgi:hypothetical protein
MSEVLSNFLVTYHASPMFPQLKLLICVYLVLTIRATEAERGFRCMNISQQLSRLFRSTFYIRVHFLQTGQTPDQA